MTGSGITSGVSRHAYPNITPRAPPRLPARVPEHQALVPRALPVEVLGLLALAVLERVVDALGDVRRLRADGDRDAAGRAVEALGRGVIADLEDLVPDDARNVDVGLGRDLACHVHLAGGDHRLHRDPAARVVLDHGVEDGVTDLVGHLVGMTLSHRLRSKQATRHDAFPLLGPGNCGDSIRTRHADGLLRIGRYFGFDA